IVGLPLVLVMILMWLQQQRAARLEQQVAALQNQIAAGEAARQDDGRLGEQLKSASEQAEALDRELTRLRAERMVLQRENTELKSPPQTSSTSPPPRHPTEVAERQPYHFTPEQSAFWIERLDFGKRLGLALRTLAAENNGQLPDDLTPTAKWLATNNVPI